MALSSNDINASDVVSDTNNDNNNNNHNEKTNSYVENNTLSLYALSNIVSYMPSAVPLAFVAAHPLLRTAAERSANKHGICVCDFCVLPVNRSRIQNKLRQSRSLRKNANITISVENDAVRRSRRQHLSEPTTHLKEQVEQSTKVEEKECSKKSFTLEGNNNLHTLYAVTSQTTDKNNNNSVMTANDANSVLSVVASSSSSNTELLEQNKPYSDFSLKLLSSFSGSSTASMQSYWSSSHRSHSFANLYRAIELNNPQFGGSADHYYPAIGEECIEEITHEPCYCTNYDAHATNITTLNTYHYNNKNRNHCFNDNNTVSDNHHSNRNSNSENNVVHESNNTLQSLEHNIWDHWKNNNGWHCNSNACYHDVITSFPYEPYHCSHCYCDGCKSHLTHASTTHCKEQTITERRLAPHLRTCSHSCDHELDLCAAVECSSIFSLNLALHATWWLSHYYGISLRLTGMTPHQLPLFEQLRSKLLLKELILVNCVLNEEWMQCISSCTELISLTLYSCTASHKNVVLHKVHSILSRPQSPLVMHAANTLATSSAIISEPIVKEVHNNKECKEWWWEYEEKEEPTEETNVALEPKREFEEIIVTSQEENHATPLMWNKSSKEEKEAPFSGIYHSATSQFVVGTCALGRLARLRHVHLINTPVLPLLFEYLTHCPLVECVLLHKVKEIQEELYNFALLPKLESLSLHGLSLTDEVASTLFHSLHSLKFLALDACWRLYDFTFLRSLSPSLRRVILSRCWCDDSGIKCLAECVKLIQLQLHSLKRVKHLEPLASLTLLERLSITDLLLHDDVIGNANDVTCSSATILNRITANMRYLRYCHFVQCKCNKMTPSLDMPTIIGITNLQVKEESTQIFTSNIMNSKTVNADENDNTDNLRKNDNLNMLVSLDFSHTSHSTFANDARQLLSRCSNVRYLNLAGCRVSSLLHTVATSASSLRWLNLSETNVTSMELNECLSNLWNIRCLILNHCPNIDSLSFAQHYHSLRFLEIANNTLHSHANEELNALSHECKKLVYLNVRHCAYFTDVSFVHRQRYLRELDLSFTSITHESIIELGQCCYLEVLNISHCTHVHHLYSLMQITSLRVLTANYLELHDIDSKTSFLEKQEEKEDSSMYNSIICSKSQLRVLSLHKCFFVDSNSKTNKQCSRSSSKTILSELLECCALTLQTLNISYCSNLRTFILHTPLQKLQTLNAAHTALDNQALIHMGQCTHIRNLCLFACPNITETSGLMPLKELTVLNLSFTNITDSGIVPLSQCALLSELYLTECHFIHDINCLSSLHHLTCVHAENTALHTKGISKLVQCTSLEELYFTKCTLLTSVKVLREALRKLRVLDVYGTAVDDRVAGQPAALPCTIM